MGGGGSITRNAKTGCWFGCFCSVPGMPTTFVVYSQTVAPRLVFLPICFERLLLQRDLSAYFFAGFSRALLCVAVRSTHSYGHGPVHVVMTVLLNQQMPYSSCSYQVALGFSFSQPPPTLPHRERGILITLRRLKLPPSPSQNTGKRILLLLVLLLLATKKWGKGRGGGGVWETISLIDPVRRLDLTSETSLLILCIRGGGGGLQLQSPLFSIRCYL
ncbi:hypothetical protein V8C37DRAFT_86491 [Trichoderma ceciliae]